MIKGTDFLSVATTSGRIKRHFVLILLKSSFDMISVDSNFSNIEFSLESDSIRMKSVNSFDLSSSDSISSNKLINTTSISTIQESEQGSLVSRFESYNTVLDDLNSSSFPGTGDYSRVNVGDSWTRFALRNVIRCS